MSDISPAEQERIDRKRALRGFAILETDLKVLRALPPEEAEWRIRHEHNVCADFLERRTEFMIDQCVTNRPVKVKAVVKSKRSVDGDPLPVGRVRTRVG